MENKTFEMMSVRVPAKAGTRSQNSKMAKKQAAIYSLASKEIDYFGLKLIAHVLIRGSKGFRMNF